MLSSPIEEVPLHMATRKTSRCTSISRRCSMCRAGRAAEEVAEDAARLQRRKHRQQREEGGAEDVEVEAARRRMLRLRLRLLVTQARRGRIVHRVEELRTILIFRRGGRCSLRPVRSLGL